MEKEKTNKMPTRAFTKEKVSPSPKAKVKEVANVAQGADGEAQPNTTVENTTWENSQSWEAADYEEVHESATGKTWYTKDKGKTWRTTGYTSPESAGGRKLTQRSMQRMLFWTQAAPVLWEVVPE